MLLQIIIFKRKAAEFINNPRNERREAGLSALIKKTKLHLHLTQANCMRILLRK
jgi:hypothetical protein